MEEPKLVEEISELRRKIMTLEWDKKRNQLNFGKNKHLEKLKEDLEKLNSNLQK